jgi:hypothetical protein
VDIRARWDAFDEEVVIHLLQAEAPRICALIGDCLPMASLQMHGLTAGDMLMSQAPMRFVGHENTETLSRMAIGDCFFGAVSHMGIIYGPVVEPEMHSRWGCVDEADLGTLARVGKAVWENLMRPWSPRAGTFTRRPVFVEFLP